MDSEMKSLRENGTFTITELPVGKNVVGGKWVYNIKHTAQGEQIYKARYVAKGFSQVVCHFSLVLNYIVTGALI